MQRLTCCLALMFVSTVAAEEPIVSGLKPGQRPGPYSFLVASGPQRGQQTCYICETAEKPAVIVFARKLSEPLGKLLVKCDDFVTAQPKDAVRTWMTVLGEKTISLDELSRWSQQAGLKSVPVGVLSRSPDCAVRSSSASGRVDQRK